MSASSNRFRWISEERVQRFLAEGFWKFVIFRGLLRFGIGGAALLALVALLIQNTTSIEFEGWKRASAWFVVGGVIWGVTVWSVLRMPPLWREAICWILAVGILAFVGVTLA